MKKITLFSLLVAGSMGFAIAQPAEDWFHKDFETSGMYGVSTAKAYEALTGRTSSTVIVAVIDGGVDINHEDLKDILWVNPGEVAGNGVDDDANGYIDDVHGWNFIGGKDGQNISYDTYEMTRLFARYSKQFEGKDVSKLKGQEKKDYELYKTLRDEIVARRDEAKFNLVFVEPYYNDIVTIKDKLEAKGFTDLSDAAVESLKYDEDLYDIALSLKESYGEDLVAAYNDMKEAYDYYKGSIDYSFNPDFDPRSEIVGDNYADANDRNYGNADVKGPDASHGTHVSGIIAAIRSNGIGMDGIADNVRIMAVRCVPNGDERDKDVANAIRYAADNGAKIINMSFGKGYSWDKAAVDEAVKYAESKGVLLIHAAGNESQNVDKELRYPTRNYESGGSCANWIEVGAMSWDASPYLTGDFSNYGKKTVDFFAPGVDIYSTTPENNYEFFNGTSMAAPVVSGCAAVLMSYFPGLTAAQVKEILRKSVAKPTAKTYIPGEYKEAPFKNLSSTGGVVNLYNAVKLAETY